MTGGPLKLCLHLVDLAGSLERTAAPIGGTCQHNRIARSFVDFSEVPQRHDWIRQEPQRDPAWHEVEFCAVIRIGRSRYLADNVVGGVWITEIEQSARQQATFSPPFIGVLTPQIIA